jgi:hypothetical protein
MSKPQTDEAARAPSKTPVFDALIAEAQQTRPEALISAEELDRRRPLTEVDKAIADEYLTAFDRLEEEQDAEVTENQARLLGVVLIAARCLRGERTVVEWAEYSGFPAAEIRAAAVALAAVGVDATRAAPLPSQPRMTQSIEPGAAGTGPRAE